MQCFNEDYFHTLSPDLQARMMACARSGFENPDSDMGCYAMQVDDYEALQPYLDQAIRSYHDVAPGMRHVNNWNLSSVRGLPANGRLDLRDLGLEETSIRIRTARNLKMFPLPGGMNRQQRIEMESVMAQTFQGLIHNPDFGGRYVSLTPGHANSIDEREYNTLVARHIMFKDMSNDPYLVSAGIASDWPFGRGSYISADESLIIWVGEEDHCRIMCMQRGTRLDEVFDRLSSSVRMMDSLCEFAYSPTYGVITSCPTNLGTGPAKPTPFYQADSA